MNLEMGAETVEALLDLLGPLRKSLEEVDAERHKAAASYVVVMTPLQERNLMQAILILEDQLRKARKESEE